MTSHPIIQSAGRISSLKLMKLHCLRILKRWQSNPNLIIMSLIYPIASFILMQVLFSGLIELLTGKPMNIASFSLVIGIMSMFTGAIMGAGTIVQERKQGIISRFASLPGPIYTSEAGRIFAEILRAFSSAIVTIIVSLFFGANFISLSILMKTIILLFLVAISVGFIAVMLGYLSNTPQGAVAFAPLIMISGFFNSTIMPIDMYAPALRGLAKYSPITVATQIVRQPNIQNISLGMIYFLGSILLSVIIITRKIRKARI